MINNIKATGIPLTDAIRVYAEEKLGSVEKFVDAKAGPVSMDVELERTTKHHQKGDVYRAELNLRVRGELLRAEIVDSNLYTAIDKLREEIIREIKSKKGRRESLLRRGSRFIKGLIKGD